jgi:hypothetical protein
MVSNSMLILVCIREEHASSKIFLHLKFEEIVHWCYMPFVLKKEDRNNKYHIF